MKAIWIFLLCPDLGSPSRLGGHLDFTSQHSGVAPDRGIVWCLLLTFFSHHITCQCTVQKSDVRGREWMESQRKYLIFNISKIAKFHRILSLCFQYNLTQVSTKIRPNWKKVFTWSSLSSALPCSYGLSMMLDRASSWGRPTVFVLFATRWNVSKGQQNNVSEQLLSRAAR